MIPRRANLIGALCLAMSLIIASNLNAEWSRDPYHPLNVGGGYEPKIAPDGSGGVFIIAQRDNYQLFAMWVDRLGNQRWDEWLYIGGSSHYSRTPFVSGPGDGTVIVTFKGTEIENALAIWDVMAQKIDTSGNLLWGQSGVTVAGIGYDYSLHACSVVAQPHGDAFIGWYEPTGSDSIARVFQNSQVMRLSSEGEMLWEQPVIFDRQGRQSHDYVEIVLDSVGVIVAVDANRNKISNDGRLLWGETGIEVEGSTIDRGSMGQIFTTMIADGNGGIVTFSRRIIDSGFTAFTQRIDADGNLLWGEQGVTLSDTMGAIRSIRLCRTIDDDFVFGWEQPRQPYPEERFGVVRVQRVDADGNAQWQFGGISPTTNDSVHYMCDLVESNGSVIVSWRDGRWGRSDQINSLYTQRIDPDGNFLWNADGVPVVIGRPDFDYWSCSDETGGAIYYCGGLLVKLSVNGVLGEVLELDVPKPTDEPDLKFQLDLTCSPSPFNSTANIHFNLPQQADIRLAIYDLAGREVALLRQGSYLPGTHSAIWNASDLPAGEYLVRLQAGTSLKGTKAIVVK